MFLHRSFPAVEDVPANREYRRYFYSRWGKETCIVSARAQRAEFALFTQRLSIKAAWGGQERYHLDRRTVAVDDDTYLVINDQRAYSSTLQNEFPVHSFSIFFGPGLAEETLGALSVATDRQLDSGHCIQARPVEFAENARHHDRLVTPLLRYISAEVDSGFEDDLWYEEQVSFLLERMLRAHYKMKIADSLPQMRDTARKEILRRIGRSTDYINTFYGRRLTLRALAKSAALSQFHFLRLFKAVNGVTPFVYLQRKRAAAARRLLLQTGMTQQEIAARVGFGSSSTMSRQLRRFAGGGARALRTRDFPSPTAPRLRT